MRLLARSIALAVVLSLLLSGPAAPLAAAQQPAPAQPDLMQEALKTTQRDQSGSDLYDVGAGFANIAYVPGKAFVCGLGVGAGVGMASMELMAVFAEPALLDTAGLKPGDRVRLAVRLDGDRLVLLRVEKVY